VPIQLSIQGAFRSDILASFQRAVRHILAPPINPAFAVKCDRRSHFLSSVEVISRMDDDARLHSRDEDSPTLLLTLITGPACETRPVQRACIAASPVKLVLATFLQLNHRSRNRDC
jgi:hypothetical protein